MTSSSRPFAEVIGDPVDHSLSPLIHRFWLDHLGIEADYRRQRVTRADLADYLEKRRSDPHWRGCNVTMPLKLDALTLADQASDMAIGTGASNLLIRREDRLLAGNTDVGGMGAILRRLAEQGAPMERIVLLGAGGAARAVLMALHLMDFRRVRIQARNQTESYKLAVQFGLHEEPVPFHHAPVGDGLINATPLGMEGSPPLDMDLSGISVDGWVVDLVTAPRRTKLLMQASSSGRTAVGGIDLLVEQAAESFQLLFGAEAPRSLDPQLLARLAV